jgi:hypothetical protein
LLVWRVDAEVAQVESLICGNVGTGSYAYEVRSSETGRRGAEKELLLRDG